MNPLSIKAKSLLLEYDARTDDKWLAVAVFVVSAAVAGIFANLGSSLGSEYKIIMDSTAIAFGAVALVSGGIALWEWFKQLDTEEAIEGLVVDFREYLENECSKRGIIRVEGEEDSIEQPLTAILPSSRAGLSQLSGLHEKSLSVGESPLLEGGVLQALSQRADVGLKSQIGTFRKLEIIVKEKFGFSSEKHTLSYNAR